jgi:hypothetical protein
MSEHNQSGAVRFQSMALVMAAMITTGGAVTSAFIQAGWVGKPSADGKPGAETAIATRPIASKPQAFFAGTIEAPRPNSLAAEAPMVDIKPAVEPAAFASLAEQSSAPIGAGRASASPVAHDNHGGPAVKLPDWFFPQLFRSKN